MTSPQLPGSSLGHNLSLFAPNPAERNYKKKKTYGKFVGKSIGVVACFKETYCLFLRMLVRCSSSSSMGEEDERRELSEGLKEGELLSACSTDRELGLSSSACMKQTSSVI